jgi:hypothetical protein
MLSGAFQLRWEATNLFQAKFGVYFVIAAFFLCMVTENENFGFRKSTTGSLLLTLRLSFEIPVLRASVKGCPVVFAVQVK